MQKKPIQLGKGMAALLGNNPGQVEQPAQTGPIEPGASAPAKKEVQIETQPMLVDIEKIVANKGQPRKIFKEKDLLELSESIKENGVIQPILVHEKDGMFEIVAGERRFRASKLAGLNKVPVIVKRATKKDVLVMSIIENVQRSDLNCVEEALAYFQLMNEFELTQEEVAKKIGKERSTIANFLRILKLPKDVIVSLQKELLSFGHAKVLVSLSDDELIKRLANEVIAKGLSVRELEELAKNSKKKTKPTANDNKFMAEQYNQLKNKLEQKTGYHFDVKGKKNGAGEIVIKFSNEAEFNDIFSYIDEINGVILAKKNEICAIIEEGCKFEGNLSFSGTVRIAGYVNGSIFSNDTLVISEGAVINADINANIVIISGSVKGTIKASSRVEIRRPARFEGTVTSPSLIVEEGVIFHGITKMKDKK